MGNLWLESGDGFRNTPEPRDSPTPPPSSHVVSQLPQVSTMASDSRRLKRRDSTLSTLNGAIDALNIAKELSSVAQAKAVFGSVGVLLTVIKVRGFVFFGEVSFLLTSLQDMTNELDYVDIGLVCADICTVLNRGMDGKPPNDLSRSVYEAIHQLTMCVKSRATVVFMAR